MEAFRRLRTNILASDVDNLPYALLVTSAEQGDGKSTIAANLAVVIAQSGRRVLVVDCDMRRPRLHEIFNLPNQRGLTSSLVEQMSLEHVVNDSTFPRVHVITSGPSTPPNPPELLGSQQMATLVQEMRKEFDVVLLDTPASLSVTDAAVLVPLVDGVLLVVARSRSRREAVRAVRQQLFNVNAKSIGLVVNRAEPNGATY